MSIFYNLEDLMNVDCCIPSLLFLFLSFFFFVQVYESEFNRKIE